MTSKYVEPSVITADALGVVRPTRGRRGKGNKAPVQLELTMSPSLVPTNKRQTAQKFFDTLVNAATASSNGFSQSLMAIAQGVTTTSRIGDEVSVDGIQLRYGVEGSTNSSPAYLRVMLVRWNPDSSVVTPAIGSVLQLALPSAGAPFSAYNMEGMKQDYFQILYDKTHYIQYQGTLMPAVPDKGVNINMKGARTRYDPAATGTGSGVVYLMCCSNTAVSSPTVTFYSRVLYRDSQ